MLILKFYFIIPRFAVSLGLFRDVSNSASLRSALLSSSILKRKVGDGDKDEDQLEGKKYEWSECKVILYWIGFRNKLLFFNIG